MRQFLLTVTLQIAFGMSAANAAPTTFGKSPCPDPTKALDAAKFQHLGELPPGEVFRAVYRSNEGCRAQSIPASDRVGTFPSRSDQKSKP